MFLTVVLFFYAVWNAYILWRGWQALSSFPAWRGIFIGVMLFLMLAYPVARFTEHSALHGIGRLLLPLGAYYLAVMVFAFSFILILDVLRLMNTVFRIVNVPSQVGGQSPGFWLFWMGLAFSIGLTVGGAINARLPVVREVRMAVQKAPPSVDSLTVVAVSDLHLGALLGNAWLEKIVERVNALRPDLVLLVGDVFDENVNALAEERLAGTLASLRARYGVYAVPGNHEYYSGVEDAVRFLEEAGITVLRDEYREVMPGVMLIGRDDRTLEQWGGQRRALPELCRVASDTTVVLLLDHQPFHLEEAEAARIDVQISGHTHYGQLIPFNWITEAVYEKSWGYYRRGNTQYYISCGVGTWGPPVRVGSRPEIVKLVLNFRLSVSSNPGNQKTGK